MMIEVVGVDESLPRIQLRVREKEAQDKPPGPASISALGVALGLIITNGHSENPTQGFWPSSTGLSSALGLKVAW